MASIMSHAVPTALVIVTALSWPLSPRTEPRADPTQPQDLRWSTQNLGPVINSPYHDAFPTISRDGLVLYFASDRASYVKVYKELPPWRMAEFDIYVARRESLTAPWRAPRRLPSHINTRSIEHSVSLSPDGHWLYFSSNKPGGCGMLDIYKAYREDQTDDLGWGEPENLGCEFNSPETDVCAIYHTDQERKTTSLFFVSDRAGAMGSLDVFESQLDPATNQFEDADVVESISTTAFEGHLDPLAGFLWTRREGGLGGSDIWVTKQLSSGEWETPVNMGSAINTEFEEQLPSPFDDGKVLYFPSDRPGGYGGLDIYVSKHL